MATARRSTSRSGGSTSGLARFLLPAAAIGIGAYLLWPKRANAAPSPLPNPNPIQPPPPQIPSGSAVEPVADAPLGEGTSRGRITGSNVLVRNGPNDNSPVVSTLPRNAGVAVMIAPLTPPTPNAPQGRVLVRTARGAQGYVAAEYVRVDAPSAPVSAADAARGGGAAGTAGWAPHMGYTPWTMTGQTRPTACVNADLAVQKNMPQSLIRTLQTQCLAAGGTFASAPVGPVAPRLNTTATALTPHLLRKGPGDRHDVVEGLPHLPAGGSVFVLRTGIAPDDGEGGEWWEVALRITGFGATPPRGFVRAVDARGNRTFSRPIRSSGGGMVPTSTPIDPYRVGDDVALATLEGIGDPPLVPGTVRGRIIGHDVLVRGGSSDTSPVISRLPLNAGVAVFPPRNPPTANAPQGRWLVRTALGREGLVAAQFVRFE